MRIYSWNVNGIRAISKKGFIDWFSKSDGSIYCLQESKAFYEQVPKSLKNIDDFYTYYHNGAIPGYAGTVTYSRAKALNIEHSFTGMPEIFVKDGRLITLEFDKFFLLNLYFPNGGAKADGTEMLPHKLDFYKAFLDYTEELKQKKSLIICGDFNIVHTEIDIARPKENENSIGFTPPERKWISKIIEHDYIDIWRYKNPLVKDVYSWWSYRTRARLRNIGWRIDYFFITKDLIDKVKDINYLPKVMGSDHCPLYLDIDV